MNRRWLINREHVQHLVQTRCGGSSAAFVSRSGIDKNTLRRWLSRDAATTYSSTVQQLAKAFDMPAAAFAFPARHDSDHPPEWLGAIKDLFGSVANQLTVGTVLPPAPTHPYVRSFSYLAPRSPCWTVIELTYAEPNIDLQLLGMRSVGGCDVAVRLGALRVRGTQHELHASSFWPVASRRSCIDGALGRAALALLCDESQLGFVLQANAPLAVRETKRLCDQEVARLAAEPATSLLIMEPMAGQVTPADNCPSCDHCQPSEGQLRPPRAVREPPRTMFSRPALASAAASA